MMKMFKRPLITFFFFMLSLPIGCASTKALTVRKVEGVVLSFSQDRAFFPGSIKLRRVRENRLTTFYREDVMNHGSGPSAGWSIEIEAEKEISVPMHVDISVPSDFINSLGGKYQPALYYYSPYESDRESYELVGSIPIVFNKDSHLVQATIDPSKFFEYFQKNNSTKKYLMSLIVVSEAIERKMP